MKYPIFALALVMLMLTACGEPKPGQKPPSLYKDREGLLSDSELDATKQAAETAEKVYPADDPAVPHAKSDEELTAEEAEGAADDSAAPHSDEEHSEEETEKSDAADDSAAPCKGY